MEVDLINLMRDMKLTLNLKVRGLDRDNEGKVWPR